MLEQAADRTSPGAHAQLDAERRSWQKRQQQNRQQVAADANLLLLRMRLWHTQPSAARGRGAQGV